MVWENTLLASRILPYSNTPVNMANNRSQESSLIRETDGKLTLLVIVTTAAGLAILLLFILLRYGCLRGKICFTRYKERRHDRSVCLLPSSANLCDNSTKGSTVTSQHTIQDPDDDRNLSDCVLFCDASENVSVVNHDYRSSETDQQKLVTRDEEGFLLFNDWLLTMKNKGWDVPTNNDQSFPQKTKSLTNSLGNSYNQELKNDRRKAILPNQRQQILYRFGQQVTTGFGFTRSQSGCIEDNTGDNYSYCYGNQVEYLSGQYGCSESFYVNRHISAPHQQETAFNKAWSSTTDLTVEATENGNIQCSTLVLQPNCVRSVESLLVFAKEYHYSYGSHFNKSIEHV